MTHVDPKLGVPLPEKDYGGNCRIYDPDVPRDPFHNFWDKMDGFVPHHFIGWWLKVSCHFLSYLRSGLCLIFNLDPRLWFLETTGSVL